MRPFIVASALIGLSSGAPAEVFRYTSENGDQEHHMSMELQSGMPDMKGGWSFTDPEGQVRQLTYSAGIEGFVPKADYLPEPVEPLEGNKIAQVKSNQDFNLESFESLESTVKNGKKSVKKAETIDNMDVIEAEGAVAEDTAVEVLRRRKRTSEPHRPQYYRHPAYRKRFNNYYYSNPSFYHGHPPQKRPFVKFAKKDGTNDESIPVAEAETTVEKMTPEKGHEHQKVFYKKKPFGYVPYQHYPVHYPYYHYTLPAGAPLQELGSDEKMMEPMTEEEDSSAAGEMGEVESEDVMEKAEVDEKNASESDSEAEVEAAAPEAEAEAEAEAVPEAEAEAESTPAEEGEKADNEAEEGETSEEEAEMMGEAENDPMTLLGAPGLRQQLLVPPPRYYPYYHHRPHVYYAAPHKHTALKVGGVKKQYQHAPQPYGQFPFYHHQPHAFRYVRYGVDPMEEAAVEAEEGAAGMVELEGMVPISPEADQDGALTQ